jgi:hypothetical protein
MLPQQFHIIPMLNNSMFYWVPKSKHASFAAVDIIAHVYFGLVAGAWNDDIILRSANAE